MNNSSHHHHQDNVVLDKDGHVYNPIDLDDNFLIVTKFVCCSIGIPLNVTIAFTIIHRRRLHRKPRNIFLLGIIFSYLTFFVPSVIKLIYWGLYPVESVCRGYVAVVGVPQGLVLLNMILALIDRYLAIKRPLLHRDKMTVRSATITVIVSSLFVILLLKFIFLARIIAPLRCEVCLLHVKIVLIILSVLSVACTVMNFIVYQQTRALLAESRRLTSAETNKAIDNDDQAEWVELAMAGNESQNFRASSGSSSLNDHSSQVKSMSIHVDKTRISQIELEATRTLITGVTSLIVTALPPTIFVSVFLGCQLVVGGMECSSLNWLSPYMIELGLIHAVYNPLIFIARNKELRTALTCQMYKG